MLKKKTLVFLMLSVLIAQVFVMQTTFNNTSNSFSGGSVLESNHEPIIDTYTPDAVPGTENVLTNHMPDGDMESTKGNGEPTSFSGGSATSYAIANFSYQDVVHTGSFAGYMSCRGTTQHSGYFSRARAFTIIPERSYLNQNIELELWYNPISSPDYAMGAESYFYIWFSSDVGNRYIYYYLSRTSGLPTNSSSTAYFDIRGTINTWNFIERNLTEDFSSVFGGADLSVSYCYYFYLITTSPTNPTADNVILFDDIEVTNSTGFNYFSHNGDFEDGDSDPWPDHQEGPGTLYTTTDYYTEGTQSMNATVDCIAGTDTYTYIYAVNEIYDSWGAVPKSYVAKKPGDLAFNFDWLFADDITAGGDRRTFYYMYAQNETYNLNLYFMLGSNDDLIPYANSSGSTWRNCYLTADGLGSRDTWISFSLDFYTILEDIDLANLIPYTVGFMIEGRDTSGCSISILVDDFQIITYPAVDPSFEGKNN